MKKFALAIAAVAAATTAQATHHPTHPTHHHHVHAHSNPLFTGAYIGASVGLAQTSAKTYHPNSMLLNTQNIYRLGDYGTAGGLHLGYNHGFKNFLGGIEIHGGTSNMTLRPTTNMDRRVSYKNRLNYGANLRLGVLATPNTGLYALGGVAQHTWHYRNLAISPVYKKCQDRLLTEVGFGMETSIRKGTVLGLQAKHGFGRTFKHHLRDGIHSIRPHTTTVEARWSFLF